MRWGWSDEIAIAHTVRRIRDCGRPCLRRERVPAVNAGPELLALGEPMIEFNQTHGGDGRTFLQGFGGDTSNFIVAAARQGARTGYITRLGDDGFGRMFRSLWAAEGVDTRGVTTDPSAPTAVYFVTHGENGHAFSYLRAGSAASRMRPVDLPLPLVRGARCLHVSGISQAISTSACDTVFEAIAAARESGVAVSYDPNLRVRLWPLARARAVIEATLAQCDTCAPSLEDMRVLAGRDDPASLVDWLLAHGPRVIALKLGAEGVIVADANTRTHIPGHRVDAVDATGCGDCFDAVFATRLLAGDTIVAAARWANAAAAIAATGYGGVAPLPRYSDVEAFLRPSLPS